MKQLDSSIGDDDSHTKCRRHSLNRMATEGILIWVAVQMIGKRGN
jgi:hypothetical protein